MMNYNFVEELRKFKREFEAFTRDENYIELIKRIITFDKVQ